MMALAGTRKFKARELPVRFKAHIESRVRKFVSYNVHRPCFRAPIPARPLKP